MHYQFDPSLSARFNLRAATASKHETLDGGFAALNLQNRSDYRRFLLAQGTVLAPMEDWMSVYGIARLLPDWPDRCRAAALAADLDGLDGDVKPQPINMRQPSPATLLGIAYVLEGSRLGAKFLARTVGQSGDISVRSNARFLTHGAGQNFWQSFQPVLEARVNDEATTRDAIIGALETFDLVIAAQRKHVTSCVNA